jgi:hypothetical protein
MNPMIFIGEPHLGQPSGSASYTCLMRAAQRLRASRALGARGDAPSPSGAGGWRLALCPRFLFEYHP